MRDWSTVASLLTALGTLVLALATFVAVRAANRAARVAEYSMQIGIRPLLMPSRLDDTMQKIMWGDEHWARLLGGGATVEEVEGSIYLAMSLRNSGSGIAVIHGWHLMLEDLHEDPPHAEPEEFRDPADPQNPGLLEAVRAPRLFSMEVLYTDHEGGQRAIGRFALAPGGENRWFCSVVKHWNLDRPDPRDH